MTGVYLSDISNTMSSILHLNVSHVTVCSSCFKCKKLFSVFLSEKYFDLVCIYLVNVNSSL